VVIVFLGTTALGAQNAPIRILKVLTHPTQVCVDPSNPGMFDISDDS